MQPLALALGATFHKMPRPPAPVCDIRMQHIRPTSEPNTHLLGGFVEGSQPPPSSMAFTSKRRSNFWAVSQAIPAYPQKLTWGYSEHLPKSTPKTTQNSRLMSKSGPFFCKTAQSSRERGKSRATATQTAQNSRAATTPLRDWPLAPGRTKGKPSRNHAMGTRRAHNKTESHRPTRKHSGAQGKASSQVNEQATQPAPNPRKTKRGRHPLGMPASYQAV